MPIDIEKLAKEIIERESRNKRNQQKQEKALTEYNANLKVMEVWRQMKQVTPKK